MVPRTRVPGRRRPPAAPQMAERVWLAPPDFPPTPEQETKHDIGKTKLRESERQNTKRTLVPRTTFEVPSTREIRDPFLNTDPPWDPDELGVGLGMNPLSKVVPRSDYFTGRCAGARR